MMSPEFGGHTEAEMVAAIKKWYEDKGWGDVTYRIVFKKKTDTGWLFFVGPECKEDGVWIDPKTLEVVKVAHGY